VKFSTQNLLSLRHTPKHLAEKILTSKAALEGERKQVTVLFADLKGSMELLVASASSINVQVVDAAPHARVIDRDILMRSHRQRASGAE
jgi:hypothetical protein